MTSEVSSLTIPKIGTGWVEVNGVDHFFRERENVSLCDGAVSSTTQRRGRAKPDRCEKCWGLSHPHGFRVAYSRRKGYGIGDTEIAHFRSKGSEQKARRVAFFKPFFVEIVELDPYTKEEWLRSFGEGRM